MSSQQTFADMLTIARQYHPTATVRLNHLRRWEIIIPTDFEDSLLLEPELDGTPAAEQHAINMYGETALERWAYKNGHGDESLGIVARRYNLNQTSHQEHRVAFDEALVAAGFAVNAEIDFSAMTAKDFKKYEDLNEQTWNALEPRRQAAEAELRLLTGDN